MRRYILLIPTLLVLLISCKKGSELTEVKTYHNNGKVKSIGYVDKDSLLTNLFKNYYDNGTIEFEANYIKGLKSGKYISYFKEGGVEYIANYKNDLISGKYTTYYESGAIDTETNYKNDLISGKYIAYYESGAIEFETNYKNGILNGKEISYHKNGVLQREIMQNNGKIVGDFIRYDDKSNFSQYVRFNHLGELRYRLDIDSLGNFTYESPHKFAYVTLNTKIKDSFTMLKYKDSLKLDVEIANPPSCKKMLYTRLNGVTKDSLEVSGIEHNYAVLPTEIGNNKLELYIDYYCTDYKLKSDYFTMDFYVVDE